MFFFFQQKILFLSRFYFYFAIIKLYMVTFISKSDLEIFSPRLIHPTRRRVLTICHDVGVLFQPLRYLAWRNYVRHPHTYSINIPLRFQKVIPRFENSPLLAIIQAIRFLRKKFNRRKIQNFRNNVSWSTKTSIQSCLCKLR